MLDKIHCGIHAAAPPLPTRRGPDRAAAGKRKGSKGGRPVGHDAEVYKERNAVERCPGRLKQ